MEGIALHQEETQDLILVPYSNQGTYGYDMEVCAALQPGPVTHHQTGHAQWC